jgi:hypothetical protein
MHPASKYNPEEAKGTRTGRGRGKGGGGLEWHVTLR